RAGPPPAAFRPVPGGRPAGSAPARRTPVPPPRAGGRRAPPRWRRSRPVARSGPADRSKVVLAGEVLLKLVGDAGGAVDGLVEHIGAGIGVNLDHVDRHVALLDPAAQLAPVAVLEQAVGHRGREAVDPRL